MAELLCQEFDQATNFYCLNFEIQSLLDSLYVPFFITDYFHPPFFAVLCGCHWSFHDSI